MRGRGALRKWVVTGARGWRRAEEEVALRAPLVEAALEGICSKIDERTFRANLRLYFPLLTSLIKCKDAPVEVRWAHGSASARERRGAETPFVSAAPATSWRTLRTNDPTRLLLCFLLPMGSAVRHR